MDYSKLVERLKCPKVRECPYDYANSCKVCQKELHRDTITAITELIARAEAAEAEIEQLRNEHLKIQYNGEELTVQEICERLEMAEKRLSIAMEYIPKSCKTCTRNKFPCNKCGTNDFSNWKFLEMGEL